jgi:DNA-directed RNA polymerase specialized sigma subunit
MHEEITGIRLTDDQMVIVESLIGDINRTLAKYHKLFPKTKFDRFLKQIKNEPQSLAGQLDDDSLAKGLLDVAKKLKDLEKPVPELNNRTVEQALMANYSHLAKKFAVWASRRRRHSYKDMLQEAYICVFKAIHRWNPDRGGNMTTLLWWMMNNRLQNASNADGPFSRIKNKDSKMVGKYRKMERSKPQLSFEQICDALNMTAEDRQVVRHILSGATLQSDVERSGASYSDIAQQRGQNHADAIQDAMWVEEILTAAKLSPLEIKIIRSSMEPYNGWQSDIAKKTINPRTNLPLTRAAIGQMLQAAQKKIWLALRKIR